MLSEEIIKKYNLQPFVTEFFHFASEKPERLTFFADGFPGIVFLHSEHPAFMLPKGKPLSSFFIYGQTVHPLELEMSGAFQMLVFQLQPFAVRTVFGVHPKQLNDDCHDLSLRHADTLQTLQVSTELAERLGILAEFIKEKTENAVSEKGSQIQLAIGLVLSSGGKISVRTLAQQLHLTERTLQRLFVEFTGLPPKQFAKIVQFQQEFNQISDEAFDKLTDIVFENGYADQSHFIRNFRRFTGQKPSDFIP